MPILDNARHERFAQELAKGATVIALVEIFRGSHEDEARAYLNQAYPPHLNLIKA